MLALLPTLAWTVDVTLFWASAPLPPTTEALMLSIVLLKVFVWSAAIRRAWTLIILPVPPVPIEAVVFAVVDVVALVEVPEMMPPLPETASARFVSPPVAPRWKVPVSAVTETLLPSEAVVLLFDDAVPLLTPTAR